MGSQDGGRPPPGPRLPRIPVRPLVAAASARPSSRPPEKESEPTVLLVGAEQSFHTAIADALNQHGVYIETSPIQGVVETVVATAPDLVLLVGDAAADGGSDVLASLHTSPHSSVVPVAILADDTALGERLRAFRHGAAAVIPRSASVDAMAEQLAKLAREIPDREREALGNVGEATLQELVDALSKELRSGILSVRGNKGAEDDAVRVVLGGGRPLAQTIDEFVSRIRRHVVHAEAFRYEFDERAGGTVQLLAGEVLESAPEPEDVSGLRVLLADTDAARADAVAQALRERKASVVVTDFGPTQQRFARLRELDPAILMIDEPSLRGPGYALVRRLRRDTRLRWTSLLVVRWEEVWSDADGAPTVDRLLGTLATLAEPEQTLRERVEVGAPFDTRLEITGPARLLRSLATCPHKIRVTVYNPRAQIRVELSDQLVAGARLQIPDGSEPIEGAGALSALMVLSSGRVHIERIDETALVNIMSTVDVALNLADRETPPIQPSLPAPAGSDGDAGLSMPPPPEAGSGWLKWLLIPLALIGVGAVAFAVVLLAGGGPVIGIDLPFQLGAGEPSRGGTSVSREPQAAPASVQQAEKKKNKKKKNKKKKSRKKSEASGLDGVSEADEAGIAVRLESQKNAASCEAVVGPSWSLLSGDQPSRAASEVAAGRRALIVGKLDEAQLAFCRATVLDAKNVDAFTSLIRLYLFMRDAKKAKEWAERGVKHHPEDLMLQQLHGDALARLGQTEEAVAIWLRAVDVDPGDTLAVRGVAHTYARGGERAVRGADYAQADRLFRRAALLDPSNARAAAGLGSVLLVQGEHKAALAWAKRAVALDSRDSDIRILLGDAHAKLGNMEKAHEAWRLAYELEPENKRASARFRRIPQ